MQCNDCQQEYVDQTKPQIEKIVNERKNYWRKQESDKSSVAKYMLDEDHSFNPATFDF